jgi:hypothetical protein
MSDPSYCVELELSDNETYLPVKKLVEGRQSLDTSSMYWINFS